MSGPDSTLLAALPRIEGRVAFVFDEDDYDIDMIVGIKNIRIQDIEALCDVAMQGYDPGFRATVQPGDVLIGGENFGFGHPHAPPMRAMRHMGISAVIADSFAPTYYRGETAMGFPQIICPGARTLAKRGDRLRLDWQGARLINLDSGAELPVELPSAAECRMLIAGGHLNNLRNEMAATEAAGTSER